MTISPNEVEIQDFTRVDLEIKRTKIEHQKGEMKGDKTSTEYVK